MTPEEYLAIPYVLVVESVEGPDGQWFRRAMYPELGISGEALSPLDAIAKLEEARVTTILSKLERASPCPCRGPRCARRSAAWMPRSWASPSGSSTRSESPRSSFSTSEIRHSGKFVLTDGHPIGVAHE